MSPLASLPKMYFKNRALDFLESTKGSKPLLEFSILGGRSNETPTSDDFKIQTDIVVSGHSRSLLAVLRFPLGLSLRLYLFVVESIFFSNKFSATRPWAL